MVIKQGRFGKFLACPGFPECRNTKPILHKIGVKCPECGGEVIERKTKTRRIFMAVPIIRNVNLHHGTGQQKKNVRNAVK